jgi:hypothetical protein
MVAGATPALAQEVVLLDCDQVAGDAKLAVKADKSGLSDAPKDVVVGLKGRKTGPGTSVTCTADPGTPWAGTGADGAEYAVKAKVAVGFTDSLKNTPNGGISCVGGNSTYGANGKIALKSPTLDPGGKNWAVSGYVRLLGSPDPVTQPDTVSVTGIVTKGVGVGGDISAELLQQPVVPKQPQADPAAPVPSALQGFSGIAPGSTATNGRIAPGVQSAVLGQLCQAGAAEIGATVSGTDGMSLVSFAADVDLATALGDIQSECVTFTEALCFAALNDFGIAYATAYAMGTYDTDSSIAITVAA